MFGDLFVNEPIPEKGYLDVSVLDKPGFGLELNPNARLVDATGLLGMKPTRSLSPVKQRKKSIVDEVVIHDSMYSDHVA